MAVRMNANGEGSAPAPPRFIALVSGRADDAVGRLQKRTTLCAALPQTQPGALVAPQRCHILRAGKA